MNEGKDNWHFIEKVGKVNHAGEGGDSNVFSITLNETEKPSSVVKLYDGPGINSIDPEKVEEILKQYFIDTERAKQKLEREPNPFRQSIKINKETFYLEYKIISQGTIFMKKEKEVSFIEDNKFKKSKRMVKAQVGQKFIHGLNMDVLPSKDFIAPNEECAENQAIFANNPDLCKKLNILIQELFENLSQSLVVSFSYGAMNAKPFIDYRNKKISIVITDLAGNLESYYTHSKKFESLRKQSKS